MSEFSDKLPKQIVSPNLPLRSRISCNKQKAGHNSNICYKIPPKNKINGSVCKEHQYFILLPHKKLYKMLCISNCIDPHDNTNPHFTREKYCALSVGE